MKGCRFEKQNKSNILKEFDLLLTFIPNRKIRNKHHFFIKC